MLGGGDQPIQRCFKNDNEVSIEIKEWNVISQSQLEMSSVSFNCGGDVDKDDLKRCLVLSCRDSMILRKFCNELIKCKNDRDKLIENMTKFNLKIKEKSDLQTDVLKHQKQQIKELKMCKQHTCGMSCCTKDHENDKCRLLQDQVRDLEHKIKQINEEDEKQRTRSDKAFEDLFKGLGRNRVDDSIITIIDNYERKLSRLLNSDPRNRNSSAESPTQNFKQLLKSYENKLDTCNKKIKQLQTANDLLRTQIQSGDKSTRLSQSEKVNGLAGKSLSLNRFNESSSTNTMPLDLKHLAASTCRKYLELVCRELTVCDIEEILPSLSTLKQTHSQTTELENFYREVSGIIITTKNTRRSCDHEGHSKQCNKARCLISTLEDWSNHVKHLKNLQESLANLSQTLVPWQPIRQGDKVLSVAELIEMVDEIAKTGLCKKKCKHDDLTKVDREHLMRMVEHFQKLFDVPNVAGVVTRMSQLHLKLNENHNVMTNIKELLGLDRTCSSVKVLDKILKMADARNRETVGGDERW